MAILVSAIVALLPLTIAPQLLYYYDITPKIAILLLGAAIALPLAVRRERLQSDGLKIFGILLLAQALSLALSTVFSTDRALSLGGSNWRRMGLITQLAMLIFVWLAAQYAAGEPGRIRQILRAVACAGIPVAIYGALQYFGWDPFINPQAYRIGAAPLTIVRPPGTLGYVSYFATYLLSVIFAGAALVTIEEAPTWKWIAAAAGALGTVALILTGTRAAVLGLVCGAVFVAVWLRPRVRAREISATAGVAVVLVAFYLSPAGQMLRSRTRWFVEDPLGGARLLLWRDSLRMAGARWPVGWGPETFSPDFPRYQSAALARSYPDFYQESPHNIFLDALVSQGPLGAAVLLGVTALGFYALWRAPDRKLSSALGAALVAILVSQQFTSFISVTAVYFYLTVGLLVAEGFMSVRLPAVQSSTGKIACATVALVFLIFSIQLSVADAGLARVRRLILAGELRDAAGLYQRIERWQPPGMRTDLWYSRAMGGAARGAKNPNDAIVAWQQGLDAAVRAAHSDEERQNAWYSLAEFYAYQNDFAHTEQSLRSAISCAPNWFKPHWVLARVLQTVGRLPEARTEASRAVDLDGGRDPEVVQTYREIMATPTNSEK